MIELATALGILVAGAAVVLAGALREIPRPRPARHAGPAVPAPPGAPPGATPTEVLAPSVEIVVRRNRFVSALRFLAGIILLAAAAAAGILLVVRGIALILDRFFRF